MEVLFRIYAPHFRPCEEAIYKHHEAHYVGEVISLRLLSGPTRDSYCTVLGSLVYRDQYDSFLFFVLSCNLHSNRNDNSFDVGISRRVYFGTIFKFGSDSFSVIFHVVMLEINQPALYFTPASC